MGLVSQRLKIERTATDAQGAAPTHQVASHISCRSLPPHLDTSSMSIFTMKGLPFTRRDIPDPNKDQGTFLYPVHVLMLSILWSLHSISLGALAFPHHIPNRIATIAYTSQRSESLTWPTRPVPHPLPMEKVLDRLGLIDNH